MFATRVSLSPEIFPQLLYLKTDWLHKDQEPRDPFCHWYCFGGQTCCRTRNNSTFEYEYDSKKDFKIAYDLVYCGNKN